MVARVSQMERVPTARLLSRIRNRGLAAGVSRVGATRGDGVNAMTPLTLAEVRELERMCLQHPGTPVALTYNQVAALLAAAKRLADIEDVLNFLYRRRENYTVVPLPELLGMAKDLGWTPPSE